MPDLCPCGSGNKYTQCCMPLHQGAVASSAEALMRSRYSAYALGLVDYIIKTTHPQNPDASRSVDERKKEIEEFCNKTLFEGLQILEKGEGMVKFTAYLSQEGKDFSFTEKSTFEKVQGNWLYLKGEY